MIVDYSFPVPTTICGMLQVLVVGAPGDFVLNWLGFTVITTPTAPWDSMCFLDVFENCKFKIRETVTEVRLTLPFRKVVDLVA